jgi:hypothetical protein
MPTLDYFILCESASLDVTRNRISFFHVLEGELVLRKLPWSIPQLTAVSAWLPGPGDEDKDFQATLKIYPPDGDAPPGEFRKNFTLGRARTRLMMSVYRIPITQPGTLAFEIWLNEALQGRHVVAVSLSDSVPTSC